jgi:hypothetical protein
MAPTTTARVIGSLFHLLTEGPRPPVICLALQDVPCDLVSHDPLAELIDIHVFVILDKLLGTIDLIRFLQKVFQSLD